ncbi:mediator of RNA polymerase II transcription subunit 1 isoform X9 [Oncorhynchus kisutch]|uniref:mediator of RNA polymerase II transcription subunit 1 isoform X9 n=1 Tax=Oncorhynchus kisutch TaxID=8019 RepID=UPI0012DDB9BE|nr:mediator of RNA polymerase II transcription subunit 1 isoform X9 [Oncorhynchus kisutch]
MAFGINLWIVLLCSIFSEHLRSTCAPHDAQRLRGYMYSGSSQVEDEQKQPGDGYPQDPIKPTFSTSGSVQSDATPRETGPNTHNQELSRRGSASSSIQPAPRMLGLSGSIASRTSVSHNKRHTRASITSGQSVTNPSAVKMVSNWEAKGIQPKTFPLQPHSSNSGSVQNFLGSHLFKANPQNSVAQSGIYQSVREMASTPYLQAPSRGSSGTSLRPGPLHFGSTEGGSATNVYKPSFSQYVKPYQSRYASASSGSTSSQYAQSIDVASKSSSIPILSLGSSSSLFAPSSTPSKNSYGTYKPGSTLGATPRQSMFTANQGGSASIYSQNALAANQKPGSTTPADSNHRQVSGQVGDYQPSYVASSGPISILSSSNQGGSASIYSQNVLAANQKPSSTTPADSNHRQVSGQVGDYQPSYVASSGPISILSSSNQGGSASIYSQNVLAANQKPSSTTPADSNHRQVSGQVGDYQPSYVASSGPISILSSSNQGGSASIYSQNVLAANQKPSSNHRQVSGQVGDYQPSYVASSGPISILSSSNQGGSASIYSQNALAANQKPGSTTPADSNHRQVSGQVGDYQPSYVASSGPISILSSSNQGGSASIYSQNVLAANQKPSSTTPADSNHRQVSGQVGDYQPSYVASSGPISILSSSNQGGSASIYSQNVLAANQKPSSTTPADSNHRQVSGQVGDYQPSYVASSGPISILSSSNQGGSASIYSQNVLAANQKPSSTTPADSNHRQVSGQVGDYQPSYVVSSGPISVLSSSNQGGSASIYSQNVLAANQKPSSTTPADSNHRQVSGQVGDYQPSYVASSGPISILSSSNQGGSASIYSQNALAANQKPGSTTPADSNHRQVSGQVGDYQPSYVASSGPISILSSSNQGGSASTYVQKPSNSKPAPRQSYQRSYTPNALKSIPSYARGPTQSRTSSTTPQSVVLVYIYNIPARYGGTHIRRLKDRIHSGRSASTSHSKTSSSVNKPQQNHTPPAKQEGPSTPYVQVSHSTRWEPRT